MLLPDTEFGDEGQDDSPPEIPPVGMESQRQRFARSSRTYWVTTLRRAGFPVFPRAAACHNEVTDESSVRAPVDAYASQSGLGRCVDRNLGPADHGDAIGVAEQVICIPRGFQISLRTGRIDGGAIRLAGFQRPLVDGRVHLAAIVQDAAALRLLARLDKTWNCQRG